MSINEARKKEQNCHETMVASDGADGNPRNDPQSQCCQATKNLEPKVSRKERQLRQKSANRARHKLLSIHHDVETFVLPILRDTFLRDLPLIANERCGSWYAPLPHESCYFKSTDGHVGTWNLSLKRLNLNVIDILSQNGQGCVILDASVRKELPDSFSRTIPIWAACMNRIAARYREELGMEPICNWNCNLYTPSCIVSKEEHKTMQNLIDTRVQELFESQAIVNPCWLATTLKKPLCPYWITPQHSELLTLSNDSYAIILVNCSEHHFSPVWKEEESFWYTPGAADDHELWARHLNPKLFWDNVELLLNTCQAQDETDQAIDTIVQRERQDSGIFEEANDVNKQNTFDWIGETNLAIGTRRAGRPPECWNDFDAVLNVTDMNYPDLHLDLHERFYLHLPVKEGKRDRTELERWMAVGIVFCAFHARHKRRILIHCAQGKDRSVAVAMATIVLFCDLTFPLRWNDTLSKDLLIGVVGQDATDEKRPPDSLYQFSGLPDGLVRCLLGFQGREHLLQWVCKERDITRDVHLATKETLRIALHLIRQDREKADPTRATMQKLNRFFMSSDYS
jgi:tRNA A64-2'-O-ribosylphosphate transferase